MKATPRSLFLSAAGRITGWWAGHAANALRQMQRAATKQALAPKPKRRRKARPRG